MTYIGGADEHASRLIAKHGKKRALQYCDAQMGRAIKGSQRHDPRRRTAGGR